MNVKRYRAFISYSHAADSEFAARLQRALERFAKPWNQTRSCRIFRDQTNLSIAPSLWPEIENALGASEHLLLLASPECTRSKWVTRELQHWLANADSNHLHIVVTHGHIAWDDERGDFDRQRSTCIPAVLHGVFQGTPLYVDCTDFVGDAATAKTSLDDPKFLDVVATIAGRLHGREKDEIFGEHIRQHRKTMRLAWGAIGALLVFGVSLVVAAGMAVQAKNEAERRAVSANARSLALHGVVVEQTADQPDLAILLELQSLSLEPGAVAYRTLVNSLSALNNVDAFLQAPGLSFRGITFSRDDRYLYTLNGDDQVRVWDMSALDKPPSVANDFRKQGRVFVTDTGAEVLTAFEGVLAAVDRASGTVAVIVSGGVGVGPINGQASLTIPIESQDVKALALSPGGDTLAMGGSDGRITLWNAATGEKLLTELPYPTPGNGEESVLALAVGPEAKQLAAGYAHGALVLWNLTAPGPSAVLLETLYSGARRIVFDRAGDRLLVGYGNSVALWDLHTLSSEPLLGTVGSVQDVTFSSDDLKVAATSKETILVWTLAEPHQLYRAFPSSHTASVVAAAVLPDADMARTLDYNGTMVTWDFSVAPAVATEQVLPVVPGANATLSRDGLTLITLEDEGQALVRWNLAVEAPEIIARTPLGGQASRTTIDASARTVAVALYDGGVEIYVMEPTGFRLADRLKTPEPVFALTLDDSGVWLAGAYESRGFFVRNLEEGSTWQQTDGHDGTVTGLAFNADASLLATGGMDQRVGLWRVPDLDPQAPLRKGHTGTGHTLVAFNPYTNQLVSSGSDALIVLWNLYGDFGQAVGLVGHALPAYSLAFVPDGLRLLAGDSDSKVLLWRIAPTLWWKQACELVRRDFTLDERRAYDIPNGKEGPLCSEPPVGLTGP
jgi:WD40 repeat protein